MYVSWSVLYRWSILFNKMFNKKLKARSTVLGAILASVLFGLSFMFSPPPKVYAAPICGPTSSAVCSSTQLLAGAAPTSCTAGSCRIMTRIVNPLINFLAAAFGLIATIMLVVRGIQYSMSEDDPQKVAAARAGIANVLLGFVGFIFLYAILQWLIPGGPF